MVHHAPHIFSHFFWVTAVVLLMESAPFVQTHDLTDGSPTVPDNQPLTGLVLNNVFTFRGNPSILGDWIEYAPYVFLDRGNPFVSRPTQCVFRWANGVEQERELRWSPI